MRECVLSYCCYYFRKDHGWQVSMELRMQTFTLLLYLATSFHNSTVLSILLNPTISALQLNEFPQPPIPRPPPPRCAGFALFSTFHLKRFEMNELILTHYHKHHTAAFYLLCQTLHTPFVDRLQKTQKVKLIFLKHYKQKGHFT